MASGQLDPYYRDKVQDTLLTRHRHQHQKHQKRDGKGLPMIRSLADIGRKMSARNLSETKGIMIICLVYTVLLLSYEFFVAFYLERRQTVIVLCVRWRKFLPREHMRGRSWES